MEDRTSTTDAYGSDYAVGDIVSLATKILVGGNRTEMRLAQVRVRVVRITAKRVGVVGVSSDSNGSLEWVHPRQVVVL